MASNNNNRSSLHLPSAEDSRKPGPKFFWVWIMCLLGLDYFSSLAYQPSITYSVAGRLGPLATAIVVVLTLLGALPVYWYLAARSPDGEGTIGILERMVHGWSGKTCVLILLGFAATDFTMLKTLSLADASVHILVPHHLSRHPFLQQSIRGLTDFATTWFGPDASRYLTEQMLVTLLLGILGFVFWFVLRQGFTRKVLYVAVPLIATYLALNTFLIVSGILRLIHDPAHVADWLEQIRQGNWDIPKPFASQGWGQILLVCLFFLPNLSLGLSGFELNMILMPQVAGLPSDAGAKPRGRIFNTRLVLLTAALIMSFLLLGSVTISTLLIPPAEFGQDGLAANRALAYLAHGGRLSSGEGMLSPYCGPWLGLLYDTVTVLILILAGTSVMTALGSLIPQFLARFGMEMRWARQWGILMLLFAVINFAVTVFFRADVNDQRSAYATGVLVLLTSAAILAFSDRKKLYDHHPGRLMARIAGIFSLVWFGSVSTIFLAILLAVLVSSFTGLLIALAFISLIIGMSIISRAIRADEKRTQAIRFADDQSSFLWKSIITSGFPILIPHRPGRQSAEEKVGVIRREHDISPATDLVLLEIELDDPSDFYQAIRIEVVQSTSLYILRVSRCCSIPHAIASIALEMAHGSTPPGIHFGWSETDSLSASWNYLAFGEGNIPWKVRELLLHMEPDPARRPRVIVG